ncbi:hypothetical protein [Streptomyces sp. NPDC093094]|uniref:hypothetical protein n=1 Tax=Streptomyces sp. NPDC093094 TaxID=3366026 RepID=UPI00382B288A
MSFRPFEAAVGLAAAGAFVLSAAPAQAAPAADADPFAQIQLTRTYTATGKYGYESTARADGFVPTPCDPGMGYHYVRAADVNSTDPARPAALVYENGPDGRRRLVAVTWIVQAAPGVARPTLFGRQFGGPHPLPQPLGSSYTLHAWIYKSNPDGLFSPTHPRVTCPADPAP